MSRTHYTYRWTKQPLILMPAGYQLGGNTCLIKMKVIGLIVLYNQFCKWIVNFVLWILKILSKLQLFKKKWSNFRGNKVLQLLRDASN